MIGDINDSMPERPSGAKALPWVILALVLLALIVGGVLFRSRLFPSENPNVVKEDQTSSGYQSIFLTNGQVYFGKLSGTTASYATLNDVYYLQVTSPPLQGSQEGQAQQPQQQLSLVKLGKELHGPVDEMKINREHILFYEDMKDDGQVMKAIREYQKNPNPETKPAQQAPPAQQQQAPPAQPPQKDPATNSNTNTGNTNR